jgi:hypothetical protein
VRRRKARRPAIADANREPHGLFKAGELNDLEATPDPCQCLSVYLPGAGGVGTHCVGFLMLRGTSGVEAFDADSRSLGLYPNQKAAADAVYEAAS